jgi:uncharacterized membrane-anchored protein
MIGRSLEQRLDAIERQKRQLRTVLLILTVAAAATVSMAQVAPFPPELRARRVVLVDDNGAARIELRAGPAPSIILRDGEDVLVELGGEGQRGVVRYLDAQGHTRELTSPMGPRPLSRIEQ